MARQRRSSSAKDYSPLVRNTWTQTYDSLGRVTSTLDPAGFTTSATYDADGNLLTITRPIALGTSGRARRRPWTRPRVTAAGPPTPTRTS